MSISVYEFLSVVQVRDKDAAAPMDFSADYVAVLEAVRSAIAQNHAQELAAALDDESAAQVLQGLIMKYTTDALAGQDYDRQELAERVFQDMAGLGILTPYLYDPAVEEININGYANIEIIYADRTEFLHGSQAFPSPETALDIVKRMLRMGGVLLDAQTPRAESYIGSGTRVAAMIPPLVPRESGVNVSIRKQNRSRITRRQLIDAASATEDMLEFLTLCLCYGVSVGVAGSTGSGKSTLMAYLLNEYIQRNDDMNNRVYIIEDSRELNLLDYDESHDRPARVIYTTTKGPPNPVTMLDLTVASLRFHPQLIVPAEVRDGAAYEAAVAGQTGHTILTSFHADGAKDGYKRLVSMCHTAGTRLSDRQLLELCIGSWPIVVFMKQLKDGSRKIMEIFEATGVDPEGQLLGQTLYEFQVSGTDRTGEGQITGVRGKHLRVNAITEELEKRLRDNGAPEKTLKRLFHGKSSVKKEAP